MVNLRSANPKLGKTGRVRGTREIVVAGASYVIVYTPEAVSIVAVLHTARDLPHVLRLG